MATRPAHTLSVSIERDPADVYAFAHDPANLPRWVQGIALGSVGVEFAPDNPFGVLDHTVTDGPVTVVVPMRVVPNGDGAEVMFTLVEPEGMTAEELARDRALVEADLRALKRVLEGMPA